MSLIIELHYVITSSQFQ